MRTLIKIILISIINIWLVGCSVYKIDVQQGNTLDQEQIDQIKVGMNQKQVSFVLGSPMLRDPFHPDRWDYAYSFKPGHGELFKQHLSLFFKQDKLVKIENKIVKAGSKRLAKDKPKAPASF